MHRWQFHLECCHVTSSCGRFADRSSIYCDASPVAFENAVAVGAYVNNWLCVGLCYLLLLGRFCKWWIWPVKLGNWQVALGWCVGQRVHTECVFFVDR
jgi:hypothetical protein